MLLHSAEFLWNWTKNKKCSTEHVHRILTKKHVKDTLIKCTLNVKPEIVPKVNWKATVSRMWRSNWLWFSVKVSQPNYDYYGRNATQWLIKAITIISSASSVTADHSTAQPNGHNSCGKQLILSERCSRLLHIVIIIISWPPAAAPKSSISCIHIFLLFIISTPSHH